MALILTLGPLSGTINLADPTKHALLANGLHFTPHVTYDLQDIGGLDLVRLQGVRATQLDVELRLFFAGASQDAMIANIREVATQIRKARLYHLQRIGTQVFLNYKLPNASTTVLLEVLGGELPPTIDDYDILTNNLEIPVKLYCQPWFRSLASTNAFINAANYTYGTISNVPGDMPALVAFSVFNAGGVTWDYLRMGIRSFGTVANFIARYQPGSTVSGDGYDTVRGSRAGTIVTDGTGAKGVQVAYNQALASNGAMEGAYNESFPDPDVVQNGGFESGVSGAWTMPSGVAVASSNSVSPMAGTVDAKFVAGVDPGTSYLQQTVGVSPGTAYRFSCKMKVSAAQPAGRGMKVLLGQVGLVSNTIAPPTGMTIPLVATTTKVICESTSTTTVTHTWDFVPSDYRVYIRAFYDGGGVTNGFLDDVSIVPIRGFAPGWIASSNFYAYKAVDGSSTNSEGEVAGTRVKEGVAAQGIGQGGPSSNMSQTVSLAANTTYRLRAYLRRTGGTGYVVLALLTNTGQVFYTNTQSASFAQCEVVFTTAAGVSSGTVLLYCETGTGGIVDAISLVPDDDANNELVRFTPNVNQADQYGHFAVYARVLTTTVPVELQLRSGGTLGRRSLNESVTVSPGASPQMVQLGHMHNPGVAVPSATTLGGFSFGVHVVPSGMGDVVTNASFQIYDVELCPIDEGFWEVNAGSGEGVGSSETAVLDCREPWTGCYLQDSLGRTKSALPLSGGGRIALPVGTTKVYLHVCRLTNDPGSSNSYQFVASYYDRYSGPFV